MTTFNPRRPIVIGNWKQHTGRAEAVELATDVAAGPVGGVQLAICPPAVWLTSVLPVIDRTEVKLGAQTVSGHPNGAFTGEVSATMLAELCSFTLVGHSERRQLFGETDADVNTKARAAIAAGLGVVLCVGETADQRDTGTAERVVAGQLESGLSGLDRKADIVVAYEPVWAIGTGRSATARDAREMTSWIAGVSARLLEGPEPAVLYGGSVNAANAAELFEGQHVDGFLVGGASLRADEFIAIGRAIAPAD